MLSDLSRHIAVNGAAIIAVAALAFRDQLKLRLLLLVSIGLTVFMAANMGGSPDWDSLFWNSVSWLINLWVTVQIVLDRTHVGLTAEEEVLFSAFECLTPGEFRRLLRLATWQTAERTRVLTQEGVLPDRLYYVLDGRIDITKGGRSGALAARTFVGEIAFLRGTPASATVTVAPQARYLTWETTALAALFDRNEQVRIAVTRLLSADMALKVSRAATD